MVKQLGKIVKLKQELMMVGIHFIAPENFFLFQTEVKCSCFFSYLLVALIALDKEVFFFSVNPKVQPKMERRFCMHSSNLLKALQ